MALHFIRDKELSRVEILRVLTAGRLTVSASSELTGLERREVLQLSKAYQAHGATALISKMRGRAGNRQTPTEIKAQGLELIKARYAEFGPTMPDRTFDKLGRVTESAVLENKRLGGLLALIRQGQPTQPPGMCTSKGPKRRNQSGHMFSVG